MIASIPSLLAARPLWQVTLIVLLAAIAAATAIEMVGFRILRRLVRRTESRYDDIVFEEVRLPVIVTVALAGVFIVTAAPVALNPLGDRAVLDQFFGRPSLTIIILVWAVALNRIVNRGVQEVIDSGKHYEFAPVFSNVWTLLVVAVTGFTILRL